MVAYLKKGKIYLTIATTEVTKQKNKLIEANVPALSSICHAKRIAIRLDVYKMVASRGIPFVSKCYLID